MYTDPKPYLDYLDKEMTIMGVLSAVCVAAPAAVLNFFLGADIPANGSKPLKVIVWTTGEYFILLGSVLCILAAFWFYKQRSALAYHFGRLSLLGVMAESSTRDKELKERLERAHSWKTWVPYNWGFTALIVGFVDYLLALFLYLLAESPFRSVQDWFGKWSLLLKVSAFCLSIVWVVVQAALQRHVLVRYESEHNAWGAFWNDIKPRARPTRVAQGA